jgi:hypothetical protein
MKFSYVFHLLFLLLPSIAFSSSTPGIDIKQPIFDFGEVFQGEKVTHTFTFVNNGDAPLLIDRLKSSCGCTAAVLSSKNIAPGEEGVIKSTFDTTRFLGHVQKVIFLYTNLPGEDVKKLYIKGVIKPRVEIIPNTLDFGRVKEGQEKQQRVVLKNAREKKLEIKNIRAQNTALSATTDATHLLPGVETVFTVFARPVKKTRHLKGYILVRTDDPALGEIRVPVRGYIDR